MRIVFLDGSEVAEPGLDRQVEKKVRTLVRDSEEVSLLYHNDSKWMQLCEWAGRRVEAAYPEKHIERVGVGFCFPTDTLVAGLRYTRVLEPSEVEKDEVERWMIDQADYAVIYMQPLLCMGVKQLRIFRYAQDKLGDRCINLCSSATEKKIQECAQRLPQWQRVVMEGLLMRTPKRELAQQLGVSLTTVHSYQLAAQQEVANALLGTEIPSRRCALLGFSRWRMPSCDRNALYQAALYLLRCCRVDSFLVPQEIYSPATDPMQMLCAACENWHQKVKITCMTPRKPGSWMSSVAIMEKELTYEQHSTAIRHKRLEERHAMIDASDILLCKVTETWRSGLSYARRKRIPVINLAGHGIDKV